MKNLISVSAVLALVMAMAMPVPVSALDLGGSVDRVSKGLSKTVDKVTDKVTDTLSGGGGSTPSGSTGGTSTASTSGGSTPGGTAGTSGGVASVSASVSKNGVTAKVGSGLLGGTQVTVGALNSTGAAQIGIQVGDMRIGAAVLSKSQLATLRIDANPPGTSNVSLPGAGGGNGGGVVGVTPDYARKLLASLSRSEELILMQRCAMILRSPKAFDAELVLLCRLVAQL
jgi:hypothetical protein